MATYPVNDPIISVTTKRTVPVLQTALTGTITVAANDVNVVGTGTLFQTEIGSGLSEQTTPSYPNFNGFLVDLTNSELRRIYQVVDNTHLVLESGFTNPQFNATIYYVPQSKAVAMSMACATGGGLINGVAVPANYYSNIGSDQDSDFNVDPRILDGSSGAFIVEVVYKGR